MSILWNGIVIEYKNNGTLDAIYKDLTSVITESTKRKTFVPVSGLVLNVLQNKDYFIWSLFF
ncbi:hypothetical protein [Staphylococcus arlettae]|uniref:hypothetical protein n=1 Tax=Staphylococcus arlettae TaxID=29378 RepID=UPI000DCB923A|nr:hypothetical protein [Staphylococcus arlettae]MCP8714659.1 hypothetical protein [Staphylococcus arlettae]MDN0187010.1 hypothetical protein [Staphylococcus arlettae]RBA02072.1 hypothetical protein DOD23_1756 [Staphylococcus arlettae]RBA04574.1 hypothetical protein DOD22_1204 [Staphylococcus arlettae]RBA06880.1 hypothetical protein DOD24_1640 [Staphylococcus arlettae]